MTTAEPVSDAYGQAFLLKDAGSGRLNIAKAFQAKLIIMPPNFVASVSSDNQVFQKNFDLKLLGGKLENLQVYFEGPEFIQFAHFVENNRLQVKFKVEGQQYGDYEGKLIVVHENIQYVVPFWLHYTEGSITATQKDGKINFEIHNPNDWNFAKISVINSKDETTDVTTMTPTRESSIEVYENGEYWIDARIRVDGETFNAFNTIQVDSVSNEKTNFEFIKIPQKQIAIIAGVVVIIGVVGLFFRRTIVEV